MDPRQEYERNQHSAEEVEEINEGVETAAEIEDSRVQTIYGFLCDFAADTIPVSVTWGGQICADTDKWTDFIQKVSEKVEVEDPHAGKRRNAETIFKHIVKLIIEKGEKITPREITFEVREKKSNLRRFVNSYQIPNPGEDLSQLRPLHRESVRNDVQFTKIVAFSLEGRKYNVPRGAWNQFVLYLCKILNDKDTDKFHAALWKGEGFNRWFSTSTFLKSLR